MLLSVNIFVLDFLKQFDTNGNISKKWESINNQAKLKRVLKNTSKDPEKPKRGKSGYLFFCDENRPLIKESNEGIEVKEVVRRLGLMWRQLKIDGKTKEYDLLSVNDRARYRSEMEDYKEKIKKSKSIVLPQQQQHKTPKKSVPKTPKEKKITPLEQYIKSKKKKVKEKRNDLTDENIEKLLRQRWKKLPVAKRMKYLTTSE